MKRRLFALALALLLAVSLPVSALARDWYIDDGDITIRATENGQTVKQGDKDAVDDDAPVIKQKDSSKSTDRVIKVIAEKDATANVTLDGVNIDTSKTGVIGRDQAALRTEGDGDVNIELDGDNYLKSSFPSRAAGLNKGNSGTLTINDEDNNGELEAVGGHDGAGIGGGQHSSASDITITGGTITARGGSTGSAAGIGGGSWGSGNNITISGGDVTAIGSVYASGIGGELDGSNITISNGKVTAIGGDQGGAGIGGGFWYSGSDITISGGDVEATGGGLAAGIGGGNGGNGTNIEISGGKVTAKGGVGGAGIGGGAYGGTGSDISISGDAQVKVQGGEADNDDITGAGAGIGNGGTRDKNEDGKKVPVDGAEVEPDTSGLTENGKLEYYAPGADMSKDAPEKVIENKPEAGAQPGAPAPVYSVTDKDGNAVSYTTAREGGVLTIRVDAAYARLTLTADEAQALTAQGVEKVVFITTGATSAFRPADLAAYAAEAPFVLTHDGEAVTFTAGETDLASLLQA